MSSLNAKRAEVARRYAAKKRDRRPFSFAKLRISELQRLFTARYGRTLPDDDCGRDEALIMAHHIANGPGDHPKLTTAWLSLWAPWMDPDEVASLIVTVTRNPIRWRADKLAQRLRLTEAERRRLRITTIGAIDMSKAERATRRRERKRQRERNRRLAKGAKSRAEYEANSISRTKPWLALGMSRARWYRQQQNGGAKQSKSSDEARTASQS
jgi:hypothetical protein